MLVHELMGGADSDIAYIEGNKQFTYGDVKHAIEICRARLYSMGVRKGDRVAICAHNSTNFVFAYLGVVSLGAIVVPINFQLSLREKAYILRKAEVHYIFAEEYVDYDVEMPDYVGGIEFINIAAAAVDSGAPLVPAADVEEDAMAAIIFTSGTTGFPKGAVLSHKNIVSNALQYRAILNLDNRNKVLCVLPLYHCFAFTCNIVGVLSCGAATVMLSNFTPKETVNVIATQGITTLFVVPSICTLLTKFAQKEDLASVTLVIIGGTALPIKVANDFKNKFDLEISEGYGLSECSPVVSVNPPGKVKLGSVGLPLCETKVKTVRPDGSATETNETGELLILSPSVMLGYWQEPEETALTIEKDGWLHTGDVAKIDEDGYIYIVDRIKDMIISMGENIYPREIEELVYHYDGIKEAAVIGVPDKLRGQAGCLFYTVQEGTNVDQRALKKYLRSNLATYKVPREFREIEALPKTSTGKIAKKVLAAMYEGE